MYITLLRHGGRLAKRAGGLGPSTKLLKLKLLAVDYKLQRTKEREKKYKRWRRRWLRTKGQWLQKEQIHPPYSFYEYNRLTSLFHRFSYLSLGFWATRRDETRSSRPKIFSSFNHPQHFLTKSYSLLSHPYPSFQDSLRFSFYHRTVGTLVLGSRKKKKR